MNSETSTARVALKWGLITGLALIVFSTVLYVLELTTNPWLGALLYAFLLAGLIAGMLEYRTANGGYIGYGEAVGLGALLSAVAGMLSTAFSVFYTTIIDPTFQERLFEQMRDKMEEDGNMSDEQIDQMIEMSQKFQSPGLQFVFGLFWLILIGTILSLIVAAFIRRNKTNPFE